MTYRGWIYCLPLTVSSCAALAQEFNFVSGNEPLDELEEIVMTASRTGQSKSRTPYFVNVITEEEILEYNYRTIPEALTYTPGVMVQKTAYGHGSPYIRGFTGRQNLLMFDGVRLNNAVWRSGPAQYWNTVDALAISKMELVQGQGSVLYGSDSVGGTMNLFSQSSNWDVKESGKFYTEGSTLYRYASNGNSSVGRVVANMGEGGAWGVHLGLTGKLFGDIRSGGETWSHTGYDEYDHDLRIDRQIGKHLITLVSTSLHQDDVWRLHKTRLVPSWHGTSIGKDDDFHYDQRNLIQYAKLSAEKLNGFIHAYSLTLSLVNSKESEWVRRHPSAATVAETRVNSYGCSMQFESRLGEVSTVYGLDYYLDRVDSKREQGGIRKEPPLPDGSSYQLFGAFAEGGIPLGSEKKWEVRSGVRYTYARASLGGSEATDGERISDSWNNAVGSARLLFRPNDEWQFFTGVSQAFRAPNIDDLGANAIPAQTNTFVNGGTGLKPERYLTCELGSQYREGVLTGEGSFFFTRTSNMIVQRPEYTTGGDVRSVAANASSGWVYGLMGSLRVQLSSQWSVRAEGGWITGKADEFPLASDPGVKSRNYLSRIPPLMGSLGVRWTHPSGKWWTEARVLAADKADHLSSSDKRDTSRIPPGGTPGYYCASLHAGWNISSSLQWTVAVENLTDQTYRMHGSGVNEPGIGLVTSLQWSW